MTELILLPGWALGTAPLDPLAAALAPFMPVRIEPLPALTTNDPERWLDELDARLPANAWLGGWSLGGMLAVALASRRGSACPAVISLAANACFTARDGWPTALPETILAAFAEGISSQPAVTLKRFALLCGQGAAEARALARQLQAPEQPVEQLQAGLALLASLDNRAALATAAQPQLHLLAEQDALVPLAAADELARLSAALTVERLAASHALPLERPEALAARIHEFLQRVER